MPAWQITRTSLAFQLPQPTFTDAELLIEQWRDILGYEGHYQVSDLGRVKSMKNYHGFMPNRILRVSPEKSGYHKVTLSLHSVLRTHKIHHLVAEAFVGPRPSPQHEVNHIDTYKTNNRAENLEWVTKKANMEHAAKHGLTASGNRHGLRKWKNAAARGSENGAHTHPEKVPHGDNHWTRRIKGAQQGERNNAAKLTNEQRWAMRRRYRQGGISLKQLGLLFGVCAQTTHRIVRKGRDSE